MPEIDVRQPVAFRTVPNVELAAIGTWVASTGVTTFTPEDFANAVAALECPGVRNPVIKLGHDEEDSTGGVRWDGEPAVGWIANMHFDGAKMIGDLTGMPAWLADADENGMSALASGYPDRSIEIRRPFLCQIGHLHPSVITALSLLGVYAPGVGVLKSMQDVYAVFTEPLPGDAPVTMARALLTSVRLAAADDEPREPTPLEKRATTDFALADEQWRIALDGLLEAWPDIDAAQRDELAAQIEAAVDDDRTDDLAALALGTVAAVAALAPAMRAVGVQARDAQIAEAGRQGVVVDAPDPDDEWLADVAATVAAVMATSTAATAGRTAAQLLGTGDGKTIATATTGFLAGLTDRFLRDQVGGALSAAQAAGQRLVLEAAPAGEYVASEINDVRCCKPCASIDGTRFDDLDAALSAYGSGKYVGCSGGARCRGRFFAVWGDDLSAPEPERGRVRSTVRMSIGDITMPPTRGAVQASVSVEDISRTYYESAGYSMWITAMHVDPLELIASDDSNGKFYKIPVELSGDKFTFGEAQEVAINYVDVKSDAAAKLPLRWTTKTAALLAAGKDASGADLTTGRGDLATVPVVKVPAPIAPDVTPAGTAIRKMATAIQTPAADPATGTDPSTEEASVPFDAAKYREAFGLAADLSDDEVRAAALAALAPENPPTLSAGTDPAATLTAVAPAAGGAVLIDPEHLKALQASAKKGDQAWHLMQASQRDDFLDKACREGRFPVSRLSTYKEMWDKNPEATRDYVSLMATNTVPTMSVGYLGIEVDKNDADRAYEDMYGKAGV